MLVKVNTIVMFSGLQSLDLVLTFDSTYQTFVAVTLWKNSFKIG